jgi:hypothetical protein
MNYNYDIGKELLTYAKEEAEFTAQRSLLDDLFPFIYVASRRMSLRAISRWLKDAYDISISYNALANAMRNEDKKWADLLEDLESAARIFAKGHDSTPEDVLKDFNYFQFLESQNCVISDAEMSYELIEKEIKEITESARVLRNRWFNLPEEARVQCYRHFGEAFGEFERKETEIESEVKKDE